MDLVLQHVLDCFELGADHGHSFLKRPCASAKRCGVRVSSWFEFHHHGYGLEIRTCDLNFRIRFLQFLPKSEWLIQKHQTFTTFNTEKRVTNRQIRSCALGARQPLIVEEFGTQEPVAHEPFIRCCCFYKWIRCDTLNSHKHETTIMIMSELLYLFK